MLIQIFQEDFDPWQILAKHQAQLPAGQYGGTAVFVGTMRNFNDDQSVSSMFLEHYPGMTEKHLEKIAQEAINRWDLVDALIVHRVGDITVNQSIVLIAAWSAHRKAAFEASRFMIEDLKYNAPFWKREKSDKGHRWVAKNTPP